MYALVVVESCFGNTYAVAEAVAAGLSEAGVEVALFPASQASKEPVADLVVVAAPTHNLGLPSPATRAKSRENGAECPDTGVKEWLEGANAPKGVRLVAIDTAVAGMFSGSAAKVAARLAKGRGWAAERGPRFIVGGQKGPLVDGELDKARALGRTLAGPSRR
jgi:sulfite reductase alpha subunit-like flavoprotein